MRHLIGPCLIALALACSACASSKVAMGPRVVVTPPAADLRDQPEPEAPAAVTATEQSYEAWNDAVLLWGRSLRDALGRVRTWVEDATPKR